MNLANRLTLARVCLVPFFILFVELDGFWPTVIALLLFGLASITDYFDGKLARKYNMITSLGIFLDPLADKLLVSAAFISFIQISYLKIPAWMVIAIISRDFVITGLRTIAASKNIIIPADKSGKFKTTFQIVVIIIVLIVMIINEWFLKVYNITPNFIEYFDNGAYYTLAMLLDKTPYWAVLVATLMTLYSGFHYMWIHRKLFKE